MPGAEGIRGSASHAEAFDLMLVRSIVIDAGLGRHIAGGPIARAEPLAVRENHLQHADAIANTGPATWEADRREEDELPQTRFESSGGADEVRALKDGLP